MATFSLNDLKAAVDKKYAPTIVENGDEKFVLKNLLQLPSAQREQIVDLVATLDEEDSTLDTQIEVFKGVLVAVLGEKKGEALLELLDDNAAAITELASAWMDGSELGEA